MLQNRIKVLVHQMTSITNILIGNVLCNFLWLFKQITFLFQSCLKFGKYYLDCNMNIYVWSFSVNRKKKIKLSSVYCECNKVHLVLFDSYIYIILAYLFLYICFIHTNIYVSLIICISLCLHTYKCVCVCLCMCIRLYLILSRHRKLNPVFLDVILIYL